MCAFSKRWVYFTPVRNKFYVHPALILHPSYVPEKVSVKQKVVNKDDMPIRNKGMAEFYKQPAKGVKLKMTWRKLRSGVNGQRGVKAKLCKTNRCKIRAKLYTDIRCALLSKEWSMVDGPASAGSIDPYGLATKFRVSYKASHFFVIRSIVGLEGRVKGSSCHRIETWAFEWKG